MMTLNPIEFMLIFVGGGMAGYIACWFVQALQDQYGGDEG